MNLSGLSIMTTPGRVTALRREIEALPWAEVAQWSEDGRIAVVFEGETTGEEIQRFKHLRALPGVVSVDMVVHYCAEEATPQEDPGGSDPVRYLNSELGEAEQPSYYQRLKRLGNY
ncbi:MAG: chaperone NapD [Deltaproteobacteria bacterium]|nr:chaperone NapD [Deltaproteobacteria bacterium]